MTRDPKQPIPPLPPLERDPDWHDSDIEEELAQLDREGDRGVDLDEDDIDVSDEEGLAGALGRGP
jgi:hypothetical protein